MPHPCLPFLPVFLMLCVVSLLVVGVPILAHESHDAATPSSGTPGPGTPGAGTPAAGTPTASSPTPAGAGADIPDAAVIAVEMVITEAAAHLGIPESDIQVTRVEAAEWPDSALGCPEQGGFYAQVITPGYVIIVTGAGETLEYHTDITGSIITLCQ